MYNKIIELGVSINEYTSDFTIWGTLLDKFIDFSPKLDDDRVKLINRNGESQIHFELNLKDLTLELFNRMIEFANIRGFGVNIKCRYRKSISYLQIYFNNNQFSISLVDEHRRNPRFITKVSETDSLKFKINEKILELKLKMEE
jgi:hypothetical protein